MSSNGRTRMKKPIFILLLLVSMPSFAENWPQWRGPTGQGISNEKNLPTRWSKTENVKWRTPLPDRGNSTPIVCNNRIFVSQAIESENKRTVLCLNREDGKIVWQS